MSVAAAAAKVGSGDTAAVEPAPRDIARYGQVFTPAAIVGRMLALSRNIGRNKGRVLDPASGDGAFSARIPGCVAIELDAAHCPPGALNIDFFAYPESEKFATVIGNPPYVKARDILPETAVRLGSSLLDGHANLYLHFIEKCVRHLQPGGELISSRRAISSRPPAPDGSIPGCSTTAPSPISKTSATRKSSPAPRPIAPSGASRRVTPAAACMTDGAWRCPAAS